MKKTIIFASAILAGLALFCGCQTVPTEISEDLDARQLIQLGQDNYDNHHYKAAEIYFNTVLERYGDDPKHYLEAKYELGHLYLKLKKYSAAYDNFKEIEEIYENVPVGLPGSYRILCGIELAKIPEEKIKEFEARANAPQEEETPKEEAKQSPRTPEVQVAPTFQDAPKEEQKEIEPPKEEAPVEASESANE
ncbi:MAG: hypothetical protein IK094_08110 [Treponema sp.]|nr:hypothetical protein [Treponema sp.]